MFKSTTKKPKKMRLNKKKGTQLQTEKEREDIGFGSQVVSKNTRLMRADGTFNVRKIGQSWEAKTNIYNRMITMHWIHFLLVVLMFYFVVNLLFGCVYYAIGLEYLLGANLGHSSISTFAEAFFFSSQTLTTVGYGRISPVGYLANIVAAVEALIGLMSFAIMTGLLYGRFSKPTPRILYADKGLIGPYLDISGLMFRMVNERHNQLINVEASVIFSRNEEENGEIKRKYYGLDLERSKVKFFAMSWTLVHPITEQSPLYNQTSESLGKSEAEFLISLEAIDNTLSDPVHSHKSYAYNEIAFNAKYASMLEPNNEEEYVLNLSKVSDVQELSEIGFSRTK
jgi:inward rectifier potassium channel